MAYGAWVIDFDSGCTAPLRGRRCLDPRPFSNLIYLMPPSVIESGDLSQLTKAIELAL